mgnify:CR=1 FL=1
MTDQKRFRLPPPPATNEPMSAHAMILPFLIDNIPFGLPYNDMIEIHWEILEEEGRTIKAIADLAKLPCKFTPKGTDVPSPCS